MSKKFITKKTIVTGFLTALMTLGSASPFWDLPSQELDSLLGTNFSVTIYAADLSQFKDTIPQWASNDISYLVDKGIIKGYDDGTFKADGQMTRLEFLTATVRSLKTDTEIDEIITKLKTEFTEEGITYSNYGDLCKNINSVFQKINSSKKAESFWGTKYLAVANDLGITDYIPTDVAISDTEIAWDKAITREEAASIMYNACTKVRGETFSEMEGIQNIIPDINNVGTVHNYAVKRLISNGLLAGIDDKYTFEPKRTLKRSEACAIIARITDQNRRLSAPVVPEDKQEWSNTYVEKNITYHNPVTGKDENRDINDWKRLLNDSVPNYNGNKNEEISSNGYYKWNSDLFEWICVVPMR